MSEPWQIEYRKEASEFHTEAKWTAWKFLPTIIIISLLLGAIGFGTRSLGLWGGTIVERKIFENSYQRSEALRSEIAQQKATIAILEGQLNGASAEESEIIQSQLNAARIRLATVRGEQ